MDDFVKSVPKTENVIYKSFRQIPAKGGFQLTKWISNCGKTMLAFDTIDKSASSSRTFQEKTFFTVHIGTSMECYRRQPRSFSRYAERSIAEDNAKSSVISCFSCIRIVSPFTIWMRLLLKTIGKENGQSWLKELCEEDSNEFKRWATEMIHVNKMDLSWKYFESGIDKLNLQSSRLGSLTGS